MALSYYPAEDAAIEWDGYQDADEIPALAAAPRPRQIDGITLVAVLLLLMLVARLALDRIGRPEAPVVAAQPPPAAPVIPPAALPNPIAPPVVAAAAPPDPASFVRPYDSYWVSQGPHGWWYGHQAVDIVAGRGSAIKSPIAGTVSRAGRDGLGNTVLEIENEVYRITLLHGLYSVAEGDTVAQGQVVGTESNQGNTTDLFGRSCRGRDCGYHTHLDVFDKRLGRNVNPLDLLK
ncbi:MAG: M23 family metallopeptidase [Candidatus Promineifilaceae bacterium]